MTTKTGSDWEKEFDKLFWSSPIEPKTDWLRADGYGGNWVAAYQDIRKFIESALTHLQEQTRKEERKKITELIALMVKENGGVFKISESTKAKFLPHKWELEMYDEPSTGSTVLEINPLDSQESEDK